jgi:hypothetical protein
MSEAEVKKAYDLAQKEIEKEKSDKVAKMVKQIVQETLEKLEKIEEDLKELQDQKKQLKMTIDDLKAGRLDLIKERLEKDEKAQKINIIKIKEINIFNQLKPGPVWDRPYEVTWNNATTAFPLQTTYWGTNTGGFVKSGSSGDPLLTCGVITSQDARYNAVGVYTLHSGVVNLR